MKKLGFTLTEVIVALGVVGVIAAVTTPSLLALRPDEKKIKVLKVYNMASSALNEILNDPSLYPDTCNAATIVRCATRPLRPEYTNNIFMQPGPKLARLLWERLDVRGVDIQGAQISVNGANVSPRANQGFADIIPFVEDSAGIPLEFNYNGGNPTLTLRVASDPACGEYDLDNNCTDPSEFIFNIDARGKITTEDALIKAYLRNPDKMNDRATDRRVAQEIWDEEH